MHAKLICISAGSCSTEDRKWTSRRRPNNHSVYFFHVGGFGIVFEKSKTGAQPFDMATGERVEKVTREQNEVLMVHPIAGG